MISLPWNTVANETIEVNFFHQGKYGSIIGNKRDHQYIFNEASSKVLRLATLDWPPYISEKICNLGWVFQLTVGLLVSKGYQVQIEFLPWTRAVRSVELGNHDILFPEYLIDESAYSQNVKGKLRLELSVLSSKFDGGLISFVKRRGEPDLFDGDISSMQSYIIGVVRGYQNTPEFDRLVANGKIQTLEAVNELQQVRMLLAKRVDYIIVDPKVLKYVINHSDLKQVDKNDILGNIETVEPTIKYNHLYYAISKMSHNWQKIQLDINHALSTIKAHHQIEKIRETSDSCLNN